MRIESLQTKASVPPNGARRADVDSGPAEAFDEVLTSASPSEDPAEASVKLARGGAGDDAEGDAREREDSEAEHESLTALAAAALAMALDSETSSSETLSAEGADPAPAFVKSSTADRGAEVTDAMPASVLTNTEGESSESTEEEASRAPVENPRTSGTEVPSGEAARHVKSMRPAEIAAEGESKSRASVADESVHEDGPPAGAHVKRKSPNSTQAASASGTPGGVNSASAGSTPPTGNPGSKFVNPADPRGAEAGQGAMQAAPGVFVRAEAPEAPVNMPSASPLTNAPAAESVKVSSWTSPSSPDGASRAPRDAEVNQILRQVTVHLRPNATELRVRLDPPGLGELRIRFIAEGGRVRARVRATNGDTAELLRENSSQLRDAMREAGIQFTDLDVSSGAPRRGHFEAEDGAPIRSASLTSPEPADPRPSQVHLASIAASGGVDLFV